MLNVAETGEPFYKVEILKVFTPIFGRSKQDVQSTIVEILKVFTPYHRKVIDF